MLLITAMALTGTATPAVADPSIGFGYYLGEGPLVDLSGNPISGPCGDGGAATGHQLILSSNPVTGSANDGTDWLYFYGAYYYESKYIGLRWMGDTAVYQWEGTVSSVRSSRHGATTGARSTGTDGSTTGLHFDPCLTCLRCTPTPPCIGVPVRGRKLDGSVSK
jgi:hypothetical protein